MKYSNVIGEAKDHNGGEIFLPGSIIKKSLFFYQDFAKISGYIF